MVAYFDLANLRSYAQAGANQHWQDCNNLLKKNIDIKFTFDKDVLRTEKAKSKQAIESWLRTMATGRGGSIEWSQNGIPRPMAEDSISKEALTSIHLVDDSRVSEVASKGFFLIAPVGQEVQIIRQLFLEDEPYPTIQMRISDLKDWKVFSKEVAPCSDVIVVDRYVFGQSDILYERNIYQLLSELLCNAHNIAINIVFFTLYTYKTTSGYTNVPFKTIQRQLKERLTKQIGVEPNVTFVKIKSKDKHDRTIFTNYKTFVSGDSYKYFGELSEEEKLTTRGDWLHISSLAHKNNQTNYDKFLQDLQKIIDNASKGIGSINGDKKSNFLSFS